MRQLDPLVLLRSSPLVCSLPGRLRNGQSVELHLLAFLNAFDLERSLPLDGIDDSE